MAIKKNATKEQNTEKRTPINDIKVLRVRPVNDSTYAVDVEVNGIKIYGCFYREGVKDGREWAMLSLPQTKGTDKDGNTKYYDIVWFPVSKEMVKDVARQIEAML